MINSMQTMKFSSGLLFGLASFVFLAVCGAHAVSNYQTKEDYYNYDDYNYDYEEVRNVPPGSPGSSGYHHHGRSAHTIPCYSCHFIFQHNHQQGPVSCKDPFSTSDIPIVNCRGACAKVYRKLEGKADFEISRNCMPNCKEFRTERDNIECCTTELCNGSMAASSLNSRRRTLSSAVVALVLLFLLLR